jgi:hypothetical protein
VRLSEVRREMNRYAVGFDAAVHTPRDAARIVEDAAAIKNMAATIEALAAAQMAETSVWRESGDRSAAHQLARTTGTSVAQAQETLAAARRLEDQPEVADAARRGVLSAQQVAMISDAAAANPGAAGRLVEAAGKQSLGELKDECARTKAVGIDLEARRKRIHEQRSLRTWTGADGVGNLVLRDNPEVIARVMAEVDPVRDRMFRDARTEGRLEPSEAYAADALVDIVCGHGSPARNGTTKILVRVDLDPLLRGHPSDGEICELVGYGPVPVSTVRDMIDTDNPVVAAIATKGKDVVGVAHLSRRPTAHQRSALEWLNPTCGVEGCNALGHLEIDHAVDWSKTNITLLDLLDRLCPHHHDLKTNEGWALVAGRGKRPFVPPDDPRHPRHEKRRHRARPAAA